MQAFCRYEISFQDHSSTSKNWNEWKNWQYIPSCIFTTSSIFITSSFWRKWCCIFMTSKIFIMSWFWRKWSCNEKSTNKLKIHIESSLSINQWQKNPWLLIIISGHHPKTLNSICFIKVSDQKKTVREGRYEIWKKWSISKNVSVSHKIASTKAPDVVLTFNIIRTIIRCFNCSLWLCIFMLGRNPSNHTQPGFICSKSTMETHEKMYEICSEFTIKALIRHH